MLVRRWVHCPALHCPALPALSLEGVQRQPVAGAAEHGGGGQDGAQRLQLVAAVVLLVVHAARARAGPAEQHQAAQAAQPAARQLGGKVAAGSGPLAVAAGPCNQRQRY